MEALVRGMTGMALAPVQDPCWVMGLQLERTPSLCSDMEDRSMLLSVEDTEGEYHPVTRDEAHKYLTDMEVKASDMHQIVGEFSK
jgi:hypothetical protein